MSEDKRIKNKPYDEVYEVSRAADSEPDDNDDDQLEFSRFNKNESSPLTNFNDYDYEGGEVEGEVEGEGEGEGEDEDEEDEEAMTGDVYDNLDEDNHQNPDDDFYDNESGRGWQADLADLLKTMQPFKPMEIHLDYKLKFFVPEYVPSIGDNDAFLKIPRPDGLDDGLGLVCLDEPNTEQSDPSVLTLKLRGLSKSASFAFKSGNSSVQKSLPFKSIHPKAIQGWIRDLDTLHNEQPSATVNYSKPMPDIENLMQGWPESVEMALDQLPHIPSLLGNLSDGTGHKNLLELQTQIACLLCDIPVRTSIIDPGKEDQHNQNSHNHNHNHHSNTDYASRSLIESLHVLFSLYSKFGESQHFNVINNNNNDPFSSDNQLQYESFK